MDVTEYLAFVPLLIYGVGLTKLMSDWKRIFDSTQIYLPYTMLSVVLSEVAIYNIFIYIRLIAEFSGQTYLSYLLYLAPPILFYLTANVFTPDEGTDTRSYFLERMRLFFILFALMIGSHFLYGMYEAPLSTVVRLVYIIILVIVAIIRKPWLSYLVVGFWLLSFLVRGNILVT